MIKQVENYISSLNSTNEFSNQTSTFEYILYERCNNYRLDKCSVAVPHHSDKEAVHKAAPYRGLEAVDGVWYFKDEIHYYEDQNVIKVAIRFAHDPLKADRRRVFYASKTDASKYVEYDEITHEDDYDNVQRVDMMNCVTNPPDEPDGTVSIAEDAPIEGEQTVQRHRHLVAEHVLRGSTGAFCKNIWLRRIRRRLSIDENGDEVLDIDMETEDADRDDVHGVMAVDNSTVADELKADDTQHNETSWQSLYGNLYTEPQSGRPTNQ